MILISSFSRVKGRRSKLGPIKRLFRMDFGKRQAQVATRLSEPRRSRKLHRPQSKGTTIKINSPVLYFNVLRDEDAALDTGGKAVTIEAIRIETVGNAAIKATVSPSATGEAGTSVGTVRIVIFDDIFGRLSVDLDGGA
jgi:hypothetical protein